jgi:hypothetical protein
MKLVAEGLSFMKLRVVMWANRYSDWRDWNFERALGLGNDPRFPDYAVEIVEIRDDMAITLVELLGIGIVAKWAATHDVAFSKMVSWRQTSDDGEIWRLF